MGRGPTVVDERAVEPVRALRRPRRGRRRFLLGVLGTLAAVAALGALSLLPVRSAEEHLEAGRAELARGRDLLVGGEAARASRAFAAAAEEFRAAAGDARHPLVRIGGFVPLAGRSYDAVGGLAAVGTGVASAGEGLARAAADLPGGLASLAPAGGRVPVGRMGPLVPAMAGAGAQLEAAREEALAIPRSFLAPPLARATEQAREEVARSLATVRSAEALLRTLPSFAGQEGTRRYFVAAQSPAELRGTGGFIGSFAILTADEGRLRLGRFREISVLRNVPAAEAPAPSAAFREIYDRFGGAGFWRNLNMTPDAPTAATMIERLYERVEGTALDGTIFVTPQALAELLEATGPVRAPILDRTLTSDGIVDYLANGAYEEFGYRASIRKRLLGIAVGGVFERFLEGPDADAALRALVDAAAGGHLTLHAADPDVQAAFELAGIAGELGPPAGGDVFGLFTSDASGTKVDYFVRREIRYEVTLGARGTASVEASIVFQNDAPSGASPSYALGPYPGTGLAVGEELSFVSVYCAAGCEMTGATEDGAAAGMEVHRELGLRSLHRYIRVEPQGSRSLGLSLRVRDAWEGGAAEGAYRVRFQGQATIQATEVTLLVRVPEGMRIVETSVPMRVIGGEATWRGKLGRELDLWVRFRTPLPARIWDALGG
jgi:hypothetical protein